MRRQNLLFPLGMAVAVSAQAQSSVTLYGLIDEGVNYITSVQVAQGSSQHPLGRSLFSISDGVGRGFGGSRWGLKGSEDLGGGLYAIFTLENGFDITNGTLGQGGAEFGRQAFVGLKGQFGQITAGRQYDSAADFVGPLSPVQIGGLVGALPGDVTGLAYTRRYNNVIKYASLSYGGFSFGGMYAPGGRAGDLTGSQVYALAAGYAGGNLHAAVAYLNGRDPNLSVFGTNPNSGSSTSDNLGSVGSAGAPQSNPIYSGFASARTFEALSAGTSYQIGTVTISGIYSRVAFDNMGDLSSGPDPFGYKGTVFFNNAAASLAYQINSTVLIGGAYTYTHGSSINGRDGATYHQGILTMQYFISKQTELYLFGTYQVARGIDSLGHSAVATIDLISPSSTSHQLVVRAGVVHRF